MKRFITLFLALMLVIVLFHMPVSLGAQKEQKKQILGVVKSFSVKQLREDFEQLKATLDSQHPMLYTNKDELRKVYQNQLQLLKNPMGELEFYRILSPIVAKLNCGHTGLSFSKEYEEYLHQNGKYMPLLIKIIADRAYVYRNLAANAIPEGAEILSINGKPLQEIITVFLNNITADGFNTSKKYYIINHWFADLYYSLIDGPEQFVITYRESDGSKVENAQISAVNKEQYESAVKTTDSPKEQGARARNDLYWQEFSGDYATLTIKSFGFYDVVNRDKFKGFLDEFFKDLADHKSSNLLLDLRDNWGGDPYCSSYLFRYLIKQPSPYFAADSPYYGDLKQPLEPAPNHFKGNLSVLINGASFSSTGHLCALLRYQHLGTFIGDESGGSYVCTDGSKDITLKNTGLRLHYATMAFKTAVTGLTPGRGIIPDYPVTPSIQDYLKGKDVEMEFALALIAKK